MNPRILIAAYILSALLTLGLLLYFFLEPVGIALGVLAFVCYALGGMPLNKKSKTTRTTTIQIKE